MAIASIIGENNFQVTLFYQTKLTGFEHIKGEPETDALKIFLLKKKKFETSKIIMSSVRERNMQHGSIGKMRFFSFKAMKVNIFGKEVCKYFSLL